MPLPIEHIFAESKFNSNVYADHKKAAIIKIRTLLITNKYSHPEDPDFGIGLKRYLFENFDSLESLEFEIKRQIEFFIFPNQDIQVALLKENDQANRNLKILKINILLNNEPFVDIMAQMQKNDLDLSFSYSNV